MAEQREQYLLNQTPPFTLDAGAETRNDLSLAPNPDANKSAIVSDVQYNGNPVSNALVKVLTPSGDPVDHQFTNAEGKSVSKLVPAGTYQVVVAAPGFLTTTPATVNLANTSGALLNVTLTPDPRALLNTVYGLVLDQDTDGRIDAATVILSDNQGTAVSSTTSDEHGEYLFCEVDNGSYQITSIKEGYSLSTPVSVTVTGAQLTQSDVLLTPEIKTNGTVQGFIRDQNGNLLANAIVALYIVTGGTETLIQETLSNHSGFYLFGNIDAGTYIVKAKVDVLI